MSSPHRSHFLSPFDPFFTTNPIGKGTGLGLSISYNAIIEQHHGPLSCQSTEGMGTTFTIELPLTTPSNLPAKHPTYPSIIQPA